MEEYRLGTAEARFADIIWKNEPLSSSELVKRCEEELQWKKSTTYTVLKRLIEKGIMKNENSIVTSLITREEYCARQSERIVDETFGGSLPAFVVSFASRRKMSAAEIGELKRMIDRMGEE